MRRSLVLSGLMGSGKSTVGARLAAALDWPFVDLDQELSRRHGQSVAELFAARGEAGFRTLERACALELLADPTPRVLAFGGFTVGDREVRRRALDHAVLITLSGSTEALLARLHDDTTRPLLAGGDRATTLRDLAAQRGEIYAEAHFHVETTDRDVDRVVEQILQLAQRRVLAMPLGTRSYRIDLCHDAAHALVDAVVELAPSSLVVVTDSNVQRLRHATLDAMLSAILLPRTVVTLPPGEQSKTLSHVATIWDSALGARVDRDTLVVAYGGGVVGDMAGFAAATLLRGVRFLQVPTTVLAMADSSVGGKTGFDHALGKNLLGAIHQPSGVVIDVAHLDTLPERQVLAGLAEIVKIAVACDAPLFEMLEQRAEALRGRDPEAMLAALELAVAAKARVVRDDEHEHGARALLNLGHTVGHALEVEGGYAQWLHGEAVALGTVAELRAGVELGLVDTGLVQRTRILLERLGLPTAIDPDLLQRSLRHFASDKKRRGGHIAIAAVPALGGAQVQRVALTALERALIGTTPPR